MMTMIDNHRYCCNDINSNDKGKREDNEFETRKCV